MRLKGPVLLEDFQLLEKIATLNRERIPPRVVHAKGAVAKGYFEVIISAVDLVVALSCPECQLQIKMAPNASRCRPICVLQVTKDITDVSFADIFNDVGKKTDIIVRFSLVTGPQGTPDWSRDPRGFAIKFYTAGGNWDLVSACQCSDSLPACWQK